MDNLTSNGKGFVLFDTFPQRFIYFYLKFFYFSYFSENINMSTNQILGKKYFQRERVGGF